MTATTRTTAAVTFTCAKLVHVTQLWMFFADLTGDVITVMISGNVIIAVVALCCTHGKQENSYFAYH